MSLWQSINKTLIAVWDGDNQPCAVRLIQQMTIRVVRGCLAYDPAG